MTSSEAWLPYYINGTQVYFKKHQSMYVYTCYSIQKWPLAFSGREERAKHAIYNNTM